MFGFRNRHGSKVGIDAGFRRGLECGTMLTFGLILLGVVIWGNAIYWIFIADEPESKADDDTEEAHDHF